MGSSIAFLGELTAVAVNDYLLIHDTSDLLNQDKRISQANLLAGYSLRSGTPTAGRVASWITPTTIGDSGVAVTQLAQKTGTPVADNLASWNDGNTLKDGGFAVSAIARKSGTPVAGNVATWADANTVNDGGFAAVDIIRKSGTQTLTILPPGILQVGDAASADVISGSSTGPGVSSNRYGVSNLGPIFIFRKSRGAAIGAHGAVVAADELGSMRFYGSSGAAYEYGAQIRAVVDGTPGAGDMPTRLEFQTSADGGATPTTVLTLGANNLATFAGGLSFGAAPQTTLNWFEEGPWTPSLTFGGLTTGITYSGALQVGRFVRIGHLVVAWSGFTLTSKGTATGVAQITGLPYSSYFTSGLRYVGAAYYNGITYVGTPQVRMGGTSISMNIEAVTEGGVVSSMTNSNFANNSNIEFTINYFLP